MEIETKIMYAHLREVSVIANCDSVSKLTY